MVNNILHAIAMESEAAAHCQSLVLRDFFDELQSAYPQRPDAKVAFRWDFADDLPTIKSDKTKLKYILHNLINNAVKFTSEGSISVSAKFERGSAGIGPDENGANLLLAVADTGVGIEDEYTSVIFEKFSQVDSSTTRDHEGIGLGLHIVKRCTELLHGKITVQSQPGQGTIFTVSCSCEL